MDKLIIASALGFCLIAGVFFAFSSFVMAALASLPPPQGIAAMQAINVSVITPSFMIVFLGMTAAGVALAIYAIANFAEPRALPMLAAGLLYVLGAFAVTMVFNVPLNNALEAADPASAAGAALWTAYLKDWTFWNSVRGFAALIASAVLMLARAVA